MSEITINQTYTYPTKGKAEETERVSKDKFFMRLPDLCANCISRFLCISWRHKKDCIFIPTSGMQDGFGNDNAAGFTRAWHKAVGDKEYMVFGYIPSETVVEGMYGVDIETIWITELNSMKALQETGGEMQD